MCGLSITRGLQISCDLLLTSGSVKAIDGSVEELKGCNRLVVWDFVTGFVNTSEREISVLAGFAVLDTVDDHRGIAGCVELGGVSVVDG